MKKLTFLKAKELILERLKKDGWEIQEYLKVPWAQNRDLNIRYHFKSQAIYESNYGCSFKEAMSTWKDHKFFLENIENICKGERI